MLTWALSLEIFCKLSTWELFDLWWSEQRWTHPAPRWWCCSWSKDKDQSVREWNVMIPALLNSASWSVNTPKGGRFSSVKADFSPTSLLATTLLRMLAPRVMVDTSFFPWLLAGSSSSVSGRSKSNVLSGNNNDSNSKSVRVSVTYHSRCWWYGQLSGCLTCCSHWTRSAPCSASAWTCWRPCLTRSCGSGGSPAGPGTSPAPPVCPPPAWHWFPPLQ